MRLGRVENIVWGNSNIPRQGFRVVDLECNDCPEDFAFELDDAGIHIDYVDCEDSDGAARVEKFIEGLKKHEATIKNLQ